MKTKKTERLKIFKVISHVHGKTHLFIFVLIALVSSCSPITNEPWINLFDGETTAGWSITDGEAPLKVEDGALVTQQIDTVNYPYLVYEEEFRDFIFECDVKITGSLNTNIMIRGISDPDLNNGKVHGFQMEIDQSERQWTGGVWEERGRLWMTPLLGMGEGEKAAFAAYKNSEWNHYRIEAIADTFKFWVNGVPTSHIVDGKTDKGIIGFQVHLIQPGKESGVIRVKNPKVITENPEKYAKETTLRAKTFSTLFHSYTLEKLATGFKFTEGPAVDSAGNVYFTDIPNESILIWNTENQLDTLTNNSNFANGLYFNKDQNLLACERTPAQITLTDKNGKKSIIASRYKGRKFNQPNDLWPDGQGGVYFTDPKYGAEQDQLAQDGMHVYYIDPDRKTVIRVCDDLVKPNGIVGTPEGKNLYVTDAQARKTYIYDINEDGTLSNKTLFADLGCDGMTLDQQGNIYFTTSGARRVDIYSQDGEQVDAIHVPEQPSNVCFGGVDRDELYITARTSLYRIKMNAQGVD
ncbi:MAG: DUF1080 domain-containing protein [Saprospiraceae bacterium]|nr:DUF1080 domain-containing protein [Saprospiraceae bacterium]